MTSRRQQLRCLFLLLGLSFCMSCSMVRKDTFRITPRLSVERSYLCHDRRCRLYFPVVFETTILTEGRRYRIGLEHAQIGRVFDACDRVILSIRGNAGPFVAQLCDSGQLEYLFEIPEDLRHSSLEALECEEVDELTIRVRLTFLNVSARLPPTSVVERELLLTGAFGPCRSPFFSPK